ncbi:MAG: RNA-binding transcriptional accessory protein [Saprospiraceae bacterium]|nr:RNA-binding transcriptional accessory protein [Saprospiraceae bacterium]
MEKSFIRKIAILLDLSQQQVEQTLNLLSDGATIPFISRYRKEQTGSLDEVVIAEIQSYHQKLLDLEKRKLTIIEAIAEQGKLTEELKNKILASELISELEDLYLPYKKKRKTRAMIAKEFGLEPLAHWLLSQTNKSIEIEAEKYISEQVKDAEAALQGARDIIAEMVNEDELSRQKIRNLFEREAVIVSKVAKGKDEEGKQYKDYFEFNELLKKCPSHRLLAILRGETEGFLRVEVAPEEEKAIFILENLFLTAKNESSQQVKLAIEDAYKRLLQPSIETETRNIAKEKADIEAIRVFGTNLRQLLLAAPLGQKRVLAIDPGFRTGCKVVCLDENGNLLHKTTIFPHPPQNDVKEATYKVENLVHQYEIDAIAIGNGTAGRESMDWLKSTPIANHVQLFMVNESGASIYSASAVAREEFPEEDVTVRGSISIGRRLADPLAELVKIDPKSIGVGQYQHDVNQILLKGALDREVESCVNSVGVNINTASKHLLTYVSGLGPVLAQNIVNYRSENGAFSQRSELKKVPRMGEKAFEQCAGFLRIRDGKNILDNTGVHPERYDLVKNIAKDVGTDVANLVNDKKLRQQIDLKKYVSKEVGLPTLQDILKELDKPGLDPRGEAKAFEFGNVKSMDDLQIGMVLPGIVTNITNFGAFVDIGIKQDGMVHISKITHKFIKDPAEVLKLNQQVDVKVMEVDIARKRVNLSIKDV